MPRRTPLALTAVLGLALSLLTPPAAQSAPRALYFSAAAGGSQITALGSTISSDLTGSSSISGFVTPQTDTNRVVGARAAGVLDIGTIETWARARKAGAGTRVVTGGRTAKINLLGGLVRAKAVETNAITVMRPGTRRSDSKTRFVNLRIGGQPIDVTVPKNTTITIPGVAVVVLNGHNKAEFGGGVVTQGFGLYLRLLEPRGRLSLGAEVLLNPSLTIVAPTPPEQVPALGGIGYGTNVTANAGDLASAEIGPTAFLITPMVGTNGRTLRNTTASVDVPGLIDVGVVTSETVGTTSKRRSRVVMTNQIAGVDLLSGLITADAIKVYSRSRKRAGDRRVENTQSMTFVNLVVGGQHIAANVSPNTKITVSSLLEGDIAEVVINKRIRNRAGNAITGLSVRLLKERGGLPAGAVIEVAVAGTYILG